jgi:Na+(H+)/acetate symporter ActP
MAVVFVYAVLGGMKGITYTQIAQYVIMIFAYTLPAVFISLQLTGNVFPQLGLGGTLAGEDTYLLDALDQHAGRPRLRLLHLREGRVHNTMTTCSCSRCR